MSRRNHLVIDRFLFGSNVTIEASMAAYSEVAQIAHPKLNLLVSSARLPFLNRMRTQPTRRWTVAMLAAHPVADIETLRPHSRSDRKRMASETFLVLVRRPLQVENFSNAEGNVIRQHLVGASMLVLPCPDAVLVLRNTRDLFRLDAPMTTAGRASARPVVFAHDRVLG